MTEFEAYLLRDVERLNRLFDQLMPQEAPEQAFERRVKSVYGDLALTRPGLRIERVREVLRKAEHDILP